MLEEMAAPVGAANTGGDARSFVRPVCGATTGGTGRQQRWHDLEVGSTCSSRLVLVLRPSCASFGAGVPDRVFVGNAPCKFALELKIDAFERRDAAERSANNLQRVEGWRGENHTLSHGGKH